MNRRTTNQAPRTPLGNHEDNGQFLLRLHGIMLEALLSFVSGWKSLISKKTVFDLSTFRTIQGHELLQVESSFEPPTIIILMVQKDVINIESILQTKCAKRNGNFTTRRHWGHKLWNGSNWRFEVGLECTGESVKKATYGFEYLSQMRCLQKRLVQWEGPLGIGRNRARFVN